MYDLSLLLHCDGDCKKTEACSFSIVMISCLAKKKQLNIVEVERNKSTVLDLIEKLNNFKISIEKKKNSSLKISSSCHLQILAINKL